MSEEKKANKPKYMKTRQEKIDWLIANIPKEEKAKRMFLIEKNAKAQNEDEETEAESIRAEAIRRLKVRQLLKK